jgi:hypothetical protein
MRYGPHVIASFEANGEHRGKVESPQKQRASHFPTASVATAALPQHLRPGRLAPPDKPKLNSLIC